MNSKDKSWRKSYNIIIFSTAIFEGLIVNAIILCIYFNMKKIAIFLIIMLLLEVFGSGYKLNKYENKWMK